MNDDLRGRLDELEDAVDADHGPAGDGHLDDTHREAVRAAFAYHYRRDTDLLGGPCGTSDEIRAFFADAADHVDDPHSTTLRQLVAP